MIAGAICFWYAMASEGAMAGCNSILPEIAVRGHAAGLDGLTETNYFDVVIGHF